MNTSVTIVAVSAKFGDKEDGESTVISDLSFTGGVVTNRTLPVDDQFVYRVGSVEAGHINAFGKDVGNFLSGLNRVIRTILNYLTVDINRRKGCGRCNCCPGNFNVRILDKQPLTGFPEWLTSLGFANLIRIRGVLSSAWVTDGEAGVPCKS